MKAPLAIGLPVLYAAAVYLATRPPKPVYTLADRTVMTVTEQSGPAALHAPEPEYPAQALRDRVEGPVRVKVTIAPDGSVAAAVPLSGPQSLREAAVRAVLGWQFAAQATQAEIEVPFSLSSAHRSIVPPAPVRRIAPQAAGNPRGSVRVVAMVSSDGQVEFAHPVAGPGELMPAAVAAVRQWIFRPMLRDGQPAQGTAVVDVTFGDGRP